MRNDADKMRAATMKAMCKAIADSYGDEDADKELKGIIRSLFPDELPCSDSEFDQFAEIVMAAKVPKDVSIFRDDMVEVAVARLFELTSKLHVAFAAHRAERAYWYRFDHFADESEGVRDDE